MGMYYQDCSTMDEIVGVVQQYHWGMDKRHSIIYRIADANEIPIDNDKPCAEYWLGTHHRAPSFYRQTKETLNLELPFLLKVLSVNEPLSIQVHPDKTLAVKLNATNPECYPDSNHKPEMAVALSPFEALCGFRPVKEIVQFLEKLPPLMRLCGYENFDTIPVEDGENFLRNAFTNLLQASKSDVEKALCKVESIIETAKIALLRSLYLRLRTYYPHDVGCLSIYFLQYYTLKAGQALYIADGVPHAYIKGECVEIMAQSDNVIRAGLTPKYKDTELLTKIVKFSQVSLLEHTQLTPEIYLYDPPVPEFALRKIIVEQEQLLFLSPVNSYSIILILNGCCQCASSSENKLLRFGSSYLVCPNVEIKLTVLVAPFLAFQAYSKMN